MERSLIVIQIVFLSVQALLYFGIQIFEGEPHEIYTRIDAKIPFVPQAIFIYSLWFPLVFFFPLVLHHFSAELYLRHMVSLTLDIVLSCMVYLVYPTFFTRPRPDEKAIGLIMRFVYLVDFKGKNCMPSMHCSMCFLMIFSTVAAAGQFPVALSLCLIVVCLMIVLSTVLTKQHVIIDVVTGLGMAVLCWALTKFLPFFSQYL